MWDAIVDAPEAAANQKARSDLLIPKIKNLIRLTARMLCCRVDTLVNITAALGRHSKPLEGSAMEYTEGEGQRLAAESEFMAKLAARAHQGHL